MGWTSITSGRQDANSPVDESLVTDAVANTEYNHDHALRGGTHNSGVRMAVARGTVSFGNTSTSTYHQFTNSVDFGVDCQDGAANFSSSANMTVYLTLEEDDSGSYSPWAGQGTSGNGLIASVYIKTGTLLYSGFDWYVQTNSASSDSVGIILHWLAFGEVSSGE